MSAPVRSAPSDTAAITALAVTTVLMMIVAGAPLYTDDLWWHLKAGEMYLHDGLWPARDWMLHTALPEAPIQHEWLFGVLVHALERTGGFTALRVVHTLWVALITSALYLTFRRAMMDTRPERGAAALGTIVVLSLGWLRLAQLRPDLVSILALVVFYQLVLARDWSRGSPPGAARIAAAGALVLVWANAHSLAILALNLTIAAGLGLLLEAALAAGLGIEPGAGDGRRGARGRALLALGLVTVLAAAVNPRGFAQHLTFLSSTSESAIWYIRDEWSHFQPFSLGANHNTVGALQWVCADLVMAAFALVAGRGAWRLLRRPSADALARFDAVHFGLGLAAIVAMLASIRFLWMGVLPIVYLLRAARAEPADSGAPARWRPRGGWLIAALSVTGAGWFSLGYGPTGLAAKYGADPRRYFTTDYQHHRYFTEGVAFLAESGLEGRLFNQYWMGGFLGYWLSPRIRTFIDGRTEHYAYDTYLDYSAVTEMAGKVPGESFVDVLDRNRVDIFFGVGFPRWWVGVYTTAHLEGIPGWILVSRSFRHSIYLRDSPANAQNLARVSRYYHDRGIPFDPAKGLDPNQVITARPRWAVDRALLPPDYTDLLTELDAAVPGQRSARGLVALAYALDGAYRLQIALDRETLARYPDADDARARLVYGYLKLADVESAVSFARGRAQLTALASRYQAIASLNTTGVQTERKQIALNRLLWKAFPVRTQQAWALEHRIPTERRAWEAILAGHRR